MGRASGQDFDVRRDAAYAPYDQVSFKVALEDQGDIASRFWVRHKEINASLKLIERFIQLLPEGEITTTWKTPAIDSEGLGIVDGFRGEIISYIRFAADNKIARFYPRDPSLKYWDHADKNGRFYYLLQNVCMK